MLNLAAFGVAQIGPHVPTTATRACPALRPGDPHSVIDRAAYRRDRATHKFELSENVTVQAGAEASATAGLNAFVMGPVFPGEG